MSYNNGDNSEKWGKSMEEYTNSFDTGATFYLDKNAIAISASCSGTHFPFKRGTSGRYSYVDKNGRLLVSFPQEQITHFQKDILDTYLDGNNKQFTLSKIPKKDTIDLFWNGIRMSLDKDFSVTNNIITTYFTPYSNNTLVVKYKY